MGSRIYFKVDEISIKLFNLPIEDQSKGILDRVAAMDF
jgi:hypothetical protein